MHIPNPIKRTSSAAAAIMLVLTMAGGCSYAAIPFLIADEVRKQGSHIEPADYVGLDGKTFAVLVSADRALHATFPSVVPQISQAISERLKSETNAAGYVPPALMLQYQFDNPGWSSMALSEVAEGLGVDRIVRVELQEFRLNDPGNRYLFDGVAAATVAVIEADGVFPDDFAYEFFVNVTFPDSGGFGPEDLARDEVASVLISRLVNRSTWPFYDAKIPNDLNY